MGDTEESSPSTDKNRKYQDTTIKQPSKNSSHSNLATGTSGAALTQSQNYYNIVGDDCDNAAAPRSSRRGRSSINVKAVDNLSSKASTAVSDGKKGSPGDPAAYLNSVRSNLNFEISSSPMTERSSGGTSTHGSKGTPVSSRPSQKKRNRLQETGGHHKPAEVFRKDLISAMKIPDTSHLSAEEYWVMRDAWRMEWEKGVQVPVNPTALPEVKLDVVLKDSKRDFRMPKKLIKTTPDVGDRDTVNVKVLADTTCRYDLDEVDAAWLKVVNEERHWQGYEPLDEFTVEIIMEELESQCHENMQLAKKTKEGLGIEYDENIVCDVCRSPECEEGNEMVFCDGCNLCVHQACYGILKVPAGSWLCKPCALGIRGSAVCILCGKKGGAMKSTKSGRKWAHMSCALWIPEINIADPERMEPITKVSHIPASRWSLLCTVCKERSVGACIQCSLKHCVTAYHVTCAMESGFDMITDCCSPNSAPAAGESAIIFRSYCQKHSKNSRKKLENSPKKTEEEKRSDRQKRIAELEEDFFTLVKSKAIADSLKIPQEVTSLVMEYWKLKRKANFNRPLVTPKQEEGKELEEAAETGLQRRLRMFTHLRQDLERVRNLCYMIGRREKLKRCSVITMSKVFLEQFHYLESLMLQNKGFDPKTLVPTLSKFGSEKLLAVAKQESKELAKTKEWCLEADGEETGTIPVPDDIEEPGETIRLANVKANSPVEKQGDDKLQRKNGLVKGFKHSKSRTETVEKRRKNQSGLPPEPSPSGSNSESKTKVESSLGDSETMPDLSSSKHRDRNDRPVDRDKRSKQRILEPRIDPTNNDDTVTDSPPPENFSSRKGKLKRRSSPGTEDDSITPGMCDVESNNVREKGNEFASARKRVRVESHSEKRKKSPEKMSRDRLTRRSPRHNDSSDLEDFDLQKEKSPKPKMTIQTETIAETERIDDKKQRMILETRKRKYADTLEATSKSGKKKRTTAHRDDHCGGAKSEDRPVKLQKSKIHERDSENIAPSTRSTRSGSKNHDGGAALRSQSNLKESGETKRSESKNEERALAPSSGTDSIGADCDKKEGDEEKISSPGQELEDQKRLESPDKIAPNVDQSPQSALENSPLPLLEKPNPAFIAAGLGISYGSKAPAPLRQSSQCKSPTKLKPSGLKWVSLGEDTVPLRDSVSPKNSNDYSKVGTKPEFAMSDKIVAQQNKEDLCRTSSSINPGKYRTGIGVFSPKSSDSSDDDFDISIPSSTEKGPSRAKLRSISNDASYDSGDKQNLTKVSDRLENQTDRPQRQDNVKANEPKNVQAVGGILDAPKSERDTNEPSSRATGGNYSQDNFFEKFSFMADNPPQQLGAASNLSFNPHQYVPARMLDFQQGALSFQSHSLFPFGTPINPWQVTPSQMPLYSYPTQQDVLHVRSSPPPLPDSTLSPESNVQNSESATMRVSSERSIPNQEEFIKRHGTDDKYMQNKYFDDNEWEIVREDNNVTPDDAQRHHKHKKRKKKKKKRKRMLFPDDYDSERREISSPPLSLSSPLHGAIVPKGHSTQYGHATPSSQDSENTESGSEKQQKLVLKINKRDLISPESCKFRTEKDTGLKLTIKKSQYELSMKEHKRHKHRSRHKTHDYNVPKMTLPADSRIRPNADKKCNMLKRLGISTDDLANTEDSAGGIGRRALRERKPPLTKKEQQSKKYPKDRNGKRIPRGNLANASLSNKAKQQTVAEKPIKLDNADIASGKILNHTSGKLKKASSFIQRPDIKREIDVKCDVTQDEHIDRAKFAGWTTKSSGANRKQLAKSTSIRSMTSQFKPSSAGLRGRGGTIPIRSFSTDSDTQIQSGSGMQDHQPARHWKKRKVQEHETQASEQPQFQNQHSAKQSNSSYADYDASDESLKIRKVLKSHSVDFTTSGKSSQQMKGQKLNQIISTLGEKASSRALESQKHTPFFHAAPSSSSTKSTVHHQKTIFKKLSIGNRFAEESSMHENEITHQSFRTKPRPSSESANPAAKPQPSYNMDFAMQTGPLNFKIPKKLRQTFNEAKLASADE